MATTKLTPPEVDQCVGSYNRMRYTGEKDALERAKTHEIPKEFDYALHQTSKHLDKSREAHNEYLTERRSERSKKVKIQTETLDDKDEPVVKEVEVFKGVAEEKEFFALKKKAESEPIDVEVHLIFGMTDDKVEEFREDYPHLFPYIYDFAFLWRHDEPKPGSAPSGRKK